MFWALNIRFGDQYKTLIVPETVLEVFIVVLDTFWKSCPFLMSFIVALKRPFKHHHNELYSNISNIEVSLFFLQVLSEEFFKPDIFQVLLLKGLKKKQRPFSQGDPKEEIQQW